MRIAVGADHGGLHLKELAKKILAENNVEYVDLGTYSSESVDYPDIAQKVATAVATGEFDRGILICGTGIGVSISANKVKGIRAALCGDVFSAQMSREHNDANILCLGERVTGVGPADLIIRTWLKTEFAGGRHEGRVCKIMAMQ